MDNEERFKNQISCAVPSDTSKRSGFNQQRQPLLDKSDSSANTIRIQKKNKLVTAYTCSTESAKHTYMHQHTKHATQPKKETVASTCTKLEKVTQTIMSLWTILRRSGLVNMQSFRQELRKSVWNTSTSSTLETCHSHTHTHTRLLQINAAEQCPGQKMKKKGLSVLNKQPQSSFSSLLSQG